MSYTDPSGYFFKSLFKAVKKYWRVIAAVAITVWTGGMALAANSFWSGLGIAAAGGAASGYVATGALKGALTGAFSAAAFYGVGSYFQGLKEANSAVKGLETLENGLTAGQFAGKIAAHAATGGIMSKLQGGKFGHGFFAAGITQAFSGQIDKIGGMINGVKSGSYYDIGNRIARVTASAVLGGTVSQVTGGKFANGAVTAAFSRGFNDEAHMQKEKKSFWNNLYEEATNANWSQILGDASYYTGWAASAALIIPGGQPIAAGLSVLSLSLGVGSVALDLYYNGAGFNEANAAGVIHAGAVENVSRRAIPLLPAPARLPATIALDSYDRLSSSAFYIASSNSNQ